MKLPGAERLAVAVNHTQGMPRDYELGMTEAPSWGADDAYNYSYVSDLWTDDGPQGRSSLPPFVVRSESNQTELRDLIPTPVFD